MKWQKLSPAGFALVRQLSQDSSTFFFGRAGRMKRSLQALRDLREPAAIPALLDYLVDKEAEVAAEAGATAEELMAQVPRELLPTLDEGMRAAQGWCYECEDRRPSAVDRQTLHRLPPCESSPVALGLVSCHWSGYVREGAVQRLDRESSSGREIPFLLLRLDDWVDAVRSAAESAVRRRLTEDHRAVFLDHLPLFVRLRQRSRSADSPVRVEVQRLLQGDLPSLVGAALGNAEAATRAGALVLAWEAALAGDEAVQASVVQLVLASVNPADRLRAASWIAHPQAAPALAGSILPRLLEDRSAAVRRLALGWCAAREPHAHLAQLRSALLDPSASARAIAQFHLPKLEPIDLRAFYREAVIAEPLRKAALAGLGEIGAAADAEVILPWIEGPQIGLRRAALIALGRLALKEHLEVFIAALQDQSPGVSKQARVAMEAHTSLIGPERLEAIFQGATQPHLRKQTLFLIDRLSKWEKLPLLIEIAARNETPVSELAEHFLNAWERSFNQTHQVQPTPANIDRLRSALAACGPRLPRRLAAEFEAIAGFVKPASRQA